MENNSCSQVFWFDSNIGYQSARWDASDSLIRCFNEAETLPNRPEALTLVFTNWLWHRAKNIDILPTAMNWGPYVVSERFRGLVDEVCPECVQWFPVKIAVAKHIVRKPAFWVMHIITSYNCVDLSKSKVDAFATDTVPSETKILGFNELVVKRDLSDAPMLFRESCYSSFRLMRQPLLEACMKAGAEFEFAPLEGFGDNYDDMSSKDAN